MKSGCSIIITLLFLIGPILAAGQNRFIDSIEAKLPSIKVDTQKVEALSDLSFYYRYVNIDSAIVYGRSAVEFSKKIKFLKGQAKALSDLGLAFRESGDLSQSLELEFQALKIADDNQFINERGLSYRRIGLIYLDLKGFALAKYYHFMAIRDHSSINKKGSLFIEYSNLSTIYLGINNTDSARFFANKAALLQDYSNDLIPDFYTCLLYTSPSPRD